jgi:hypothetical protein
MARSRGGISDTAEIPPLRPRLRTEKTERQSTLLGERGRPVDYRYRWFKPR